MGIIKGIRPLHIVKDDNQKYAGGPRIKLEGKRVLFPTIRNNLVSNLIQKFTREELHEKFPDIFPDDE